MASRRKRRAEESPRKRRYVDTATRYEGIFARHSLYCDLGVGKEHCTCEPSYYGTVWDNEIGRNHRTKRAPNVSEARNLRADLVAAVRSGNVVDRVPRLRFGDAHKEFIRDCRAGIALNKQGKRYTKKAITNLDSSLNRLPSTIRGRDLGEVTAGQLQGAVDEFLRAGLSSSRIRSVVNAVRSLYRWAVQREKAKANPAEDIRLPANDSKEIDRVATPGELAFLLSRLDRRDAIPFALAAYGTARAQEIQVLEWPEVDFEHGVVLLAADDEARKSEAARRIVPLVEPLRERLRAEWESQGEPASGRVCPPRKQSASGMISLNQLQKRIKRRWENLCLTPIGLQECRHTAATWLDHAGVAPKVASSFMGHKAPGRQPDAAPITLRRYTHVLPGELDRARDKLDAFLAERLAEEEGRDFHLVSESSTSRMDGDQG